MDTAEWKAFEWTCLACKDHSLRVLEIVIQLDGRLIFRNECVKCKREETFAFYVEELALLHSRTSWSGHYVYPDSTAENRAHVSLRPLFRCAFCGGLPGAIRTLEFSPAGFRLTYYCRECDRGDAADQQLNFEEILHFAHRERAYLPQQVPEKIHFDEIERGMARGHSLH